MRFATPARLLSYEMSSTILSSLGEPVLHSNSLATITDNWVVVRGAQSHAQILVSIESVSEVKTFKTTQFRYLACAVGSLLMSAATLWSKEADGATVPFALVGAALLTGAQVTRLAAVAFVIEDEIIRTQYGNLRDAATLVSLVRAAQNGRRRGSQPAYNFFHWVRAYVALLV